MIYECKFPKPFFFLKLIYRERKCIFNSFLFVFTDDVLRHITQTNVRAAETVKTEMDRERMTTFQQIKDFYRQNVKTILQSEIVG